MDHILANKAVFKEATGGAAVAAAVTSVALANHRQGEAALIAGGVAVIAGILSATTTPEADIRSWDNLPRYLTFAPLQLPPGPAWQYCIGGVATPTEPSSSAPACAR